MKNSVILSLIAGKNYDLEVSKILTCLFTFPLTSVRLLALPVRFVYVCMC